MSDVNTEQTGEVQEIERSPIEQEAMQHGWKPQDQYDGDPAKWRSAELFMELKPFYEKIESQSRQIKQNQKQFAQIAKDMATIRQQSYNKAVEDLKNQKRSAMKEGDFERASLIDDQIDTFRQQQEIAERQHAQAQQEIQFQQPNTPPPAFVEWKARNTWYERDEDLKDWADARGIRMAQAGTPPDEVLRVIESEVKRKFPQKFENPNKTPPAPIQGQGKTPAKSAKNNMTSEERRIMERIIDSGVMTEEEYLKQFSELE